jgi:hypothetical protein
MRQFGTLEWLSRIIVGGTLMVVLIFIFCWRRFDESAHTGLPDSTAQEIAATFAPIVASTLLGYRDFLFRGVAVGGQKAVAPIRIQSGAFELYGAAILGLATAIGAIFWIQSGVTDQQARVAMGGGATIWSGTIVYVLNKVLKQFIQADQAKS